MNKSNFFQHNVCIGVLDFGKAARWLFLSQFGSLLKGVMFFEAAEEAGNALNQT